MTTPTEPDCITPEVRKTLEQNGVRIVELGRPARSPDGKYRCMVVLEQVEAKAALTALDRKEMSW